MKVYVNIENKNWKKYKIDFEKIANAAVSAEHKDAEVSITLVDDKAIRNLNREYRGFDKPTNVLSFVIPALFMIPHNAPYFSVNAESFVRQSSLSEMSN